MVNASLIAALQVVPGHLKPTHSPAKSDSSHSHSLHSSRSPPLHKKRRNTPSPRSWQRDTPPRSRGDSPVRRKGRRRSPTPKSSSESEDRTPSPKRKKAEVDPLTTRTGGAYIPPARLRMMQKEISDKSSVAYQRISWEALKKSINGLINKVTESLSPC